MLNLRFFFLCSKISCSSFSVLKLHVILRILVSNVLSSCNIVFRLVLNHLESSDFFFPIHLHSLHLLQFQVYDLVIFLLKVAYPINKLITFCDNWFCSFLWNKLWFFRVYLDVLTSLLIKRGIYKSKKNLPYLCASLKTEKKCYFLCFWNLFCLLNFYYKGHFSRLSWQF